MNDEPHPRRASSGAHPSDVNTDSKQVFEALGEPEAWKGEPHRWSDAIAAYPAGPLPFLDTTALSEKCRIAGIAEDRIPLLTALADEITRDPHLRVLAWYLFWCVLVACDSTGDWDLPSLKPRLGNRDGLLYLLLALEYPGQLAEYHRTLGYPREVTADTARKVAWEEAIHVTGAGVPGISSDQYRWFNSYLLSPSARLGRFEYNLRDEWGEYYYIFRREADGAVIALIGGDLQVGEDGLLLDEDAPPSTGWTTSWSKTEEAITAYPIHPNGRILRREVRLPRPEWKQVPAMTGPGQFDSEARLEMHVPFGGGMDWDSVRESLNRAEAFFRRYVPSKPIRLFSMTTWFMDPRVPEILGESSNPARFLRACYLVPDTPHSGLLSSLIFHRNVATTPVDELPARTSVQRVIIAFLKRGGVWQGGGMFILPEDLPHLREGLYRDRFAALSREFGLEGLR